MVVDELIHRLIPRHVARAISNQAPTFIEACLLGQLRRRGHIWRRCIVGPCRRRSLCWRGRKWDARWWLLGNFDAHCSVVANFRVIFATLLSAIFVAVTSGFRVRRPLGTVSYTHLRAHETPEHLVCR